MTKFSKMIDKATALTRTGNLSKATAAIQAALSGHQDQTPARRTPLGETLRRIGAGGMPASTRFRPETSLPAGASFRRLTHSGAQGSRDYRLYVPANRTEQMPVRNGAGQAHTVAVQAIWQEIASPSAIHCDKNLGQLRNNAFEKWQELLDSNSVPKY